MGIHTTSGKRKPHRNGRGRAFWPAPASIDDGVTRFVKMTVEAQALAKIIAAAQSQTSTVLLERPTAIDTARAVAKSEGLVVVDVVRADYQDDGDWLVEMRVER